MSLYEITTDGVKAQSALNKQLLAECIADFRRSFYRFVQTRNDRTIFSTLFLKAFADNKGELTAELDPTLMELHRTVGDLWELLFAQYKTLGSYDMFATLAFARVMEDVRVMKAELDLWVDTVTSLFSAYDEETKKSLMAWAWCANQLTGAGKSAGETDGGIPSAFGLAAKYLACTMDHHALIARGEVLCEYLMTYHQFPSMARNMFVVMEQIEAEEVNLAQYFAHRAMVGFERTVMNAAGIGMIPNAKDAGNIAKFLGKLFETNMFQKDELFVHMLSHNALYINTVMTTLLGFYQQTKKPHWLVKTDIPAFCRQASQTLLNFRTQMGDQRKLLEEESK